MCGDIVMGMIFRPTWNEKKEINLILKVDGIIEYLRIPYQNCIIPIFSDINIKMSGMSDKDLKLLFMKSGGLCAIPTCRKKLSIEKTDSGDDESIIGQMAHIKGEKPGSKRYDSTMSENERNGYGNRILLCSVCHKMIDDQDKEYTVEKIHKIKDEHEKWIDRILAQEITNITFVELEIITKYLTANNLEYKENYQFTNQIEKIKKNQLSENISRLIAMGVTQVKLVEQYIDSNLDPSYGERLRDGFVNEYIRLKNEGLQGDEMFYSLLAFSGGMTSDVKRSSAGLAVLSYFFEICEVFEK